MHLNYTIDFNSLSLMLNHFYNSYFVIEYINRFNIIDFKINYKIKDK